MVSISATSSLPNVALQFDSIETPQQKVQREAKEIGESVWQKLKTDKLTWSLLPPGHMSHWDIEIWKDCARFIKVFNHCKHGLPGHENAEKELKDKYDNSYELACESFENNIRTMLFPYEEESDLKQLPILELPPIDWHQWGAKDWKSYAAFLRSEVNGFLINENGCNNVLIYFFNTIRKSPNGKLTENLQEVEKIIASLKPKKKFTKLKRNPIHAHCRTAAHSPIAKEASNKLADDQALSYDYNPAKWNLAVWKKFHSEESVKGKNPVFDIIRIAATPIYFNSRPLYNFLPTPLEKKIYTAKLENAFFLINQLFRKIVNGEYDQIPVVTLSKKISREQLVHLEIPFAICKVKEEGNEYLIFKFNSKKVHLLDCLRASPGSFLYYNGIKNFIFQIEQTGIYDEHTDDFITPLNESHHKVRDWKRRASEHLDAAISTSIQINDVRTMIKGYIYPETIDDETVETVRQPCSLLGTLLRIFKFATRS